MHYQEGWLYYWVPGLLVLMLVSPSVHGVQTSSAPLFVAWLGPCQPLSSAITPLCVRSEHHYLHSNGQIIQYSTHMVVLLLQDYRRIFWLPLIPKTFWKWQHFDLALIFPGVVYQSEKSVSFTFLSVMGGCINIAVLCLFKLWQNHLWKWIIPHAFKKITTQMQKLQLKEEKKKVVGSGWAGAAICGISTRPPVFTWLHTPTVITLAQGATQKYITLISLHIIFILLQKTPEFTLAKRMYWRIYST